jgi:hypothetical protein
MNNERTDIGVQELVGSDESNANISDQAPIAHAPAAKKNITIRPEPVTRVK